MSHTKKEIKTKKFDLISPEWEKQPNESINSYELFRTFLRLPQKSYRILAKSIGTPDHLQHKEEQRITKLAQMWRWQERVAHYINWIDKQAVEDDKKLRKESKKRLLISAQAIETGLMLPIRKLLQKQDKISLELDALSAEKLLNLVFRSAEKLIQVSEFERKINGEASETINQTNTNVNVNYNTDTLTDSELKNLAKELGFHRKYE